MAKESTANAQTRIIERDLANLSQRFDRHLEIYAQNGREFIALKIAVDNLRQTIEYRNNEFGSEQTLFRQELKAHVEKVNSLELDLSKLASKIGVYATIGSAFASAAVTILIKVFIG